MGFYLTGINIEADMDKCEYVIKMGMPTTKKEVMKLNELLISLNRPIKANWREFSMSGFI